MRKTGSVNEDQTEGDCDQDEDARPEPPAGTSMPGLEVGQESMHAYENMACNHLDFLHVLVTHDEVSSERLRNGRLE